MIDILIPLAGLISTVIIYCLVHIKKMVGKENWEITVSHIQGFLNGCAVTVTAMAIIAYFVL